MLAQVLIAALTLPAPHPADQIRVSKANRTLALSWKGKVFKTYRVALGRVPLGAKDREWDGRTPEGTFTIDYRNGRSQFYKALHISYPQPAHVARARDLGVKPGGDVMIHGLPNGFGHIGPLHTANDWTQGCIGVTNQEMDELWKLVPDGTKIEIVP